MRAPARPRPQTLHVFLRVLCAGKNIIFIFYIYFSVYTVYNVYKCHSTNILSVNRGVN